MANQFTNQSTTSMSNFMTLLADFVVTTMGWTGETVTAGTVVKGVDHAAGTAGWSKAAQGTNTNDIQVAFQWDVSGTVNSLGIYQYNHASGAGNYDATRAGPWDQNGDSGNGAAAVAEASLVASRCVVITDAPLQFWAFAGTSPVEYVYVVVEVTAGEYVHFQFGELQKFNDWTGGAFACGYRWPTSTGSAPAVQPLNSQLLDGYTRGTAHQVYFSSVNAEGLPNQVANGMWALACSPEQYYLYSMGTDRQNNDGVTADTARAVFQGGFRQSIEASQYGNYGASPLTGFVAGYPITCVYLDTVPAIDDWYGPMGVMDGVLGTNTGQFVGGEDITIGSVVWTIFPTKRKGAGNESGSSANQAIMYRNNVV